MSAKPDAMNAAQRTGKRIPEMFITYAIIVFIKKTRFFSYFATFHWIIMYQYVYLYKKMNPIRH